MEIVTEGRLRGVITDEEVVGRLPDPEPRYLITLVVLYTW
jgi:hypothetical protein